jgi:hypothetical protein
VFGGNMVADLNFKDNVKANFGTGNDLQIFHDGSDSIIRDAGTGSLKFQYGTSDGVVFDSSGNVGIGTVSPSYPLEVHGSTGQIILAQADSGTGYVRVDSSNAGSEAVFWARATNTGYSTIQFGDPDDSDVGWIKYEHSNNSMQFRTNASEAGRWDANGNLLVGTTDYAVYDNNANNSTDNGINIRNDGKLDAARYSSIVLGLNRTGTDGTIAEFRKSGTVVGSIGNSGSDLYVDSADDLFLYAGGNIGLGVFQSGGSLQNVSIYTHLYPNGSLNLGASGSQWNNLHLSGGVVFGDAGGSGTSTSNTLDSYEEGTWTASFAGSATTATGNYTKVGNTVFITVYGSSLNVTSTPTATISGLPFTNNGGYSVASITHDTYSNNSYNGYFGSGTTTIIPIQDGTISGSAAVVGNPKYIMVSGTYITNS